MKSPPLTFGFHGRSSLLLLAAVASVAMKPSFGWVHPAVPPSSSTSAKPATPPVAPSSVLKPTSLSLKLPTTPTTTTTATTSLSAKKRTSRGFGAKKKDNSKQTAAVDQSLPLVSESKSIQEVMNPRYSDPAVIDDIKARIRAGEVVILRDAFVPELAEAMHAALATTQHWEHNEDYHTDGYHFRHYNIYNQQDFPQICKDLHKNVFSSPETRAFMTELTGRDCNSETVTGAPSYYGSGDHSLPHTDHIGQRSVAYIWHLARDWQPEWGGAMYWAHTRNPEPLANAFHHASFNSLVLFSVTPHSAHFVTTVSPLAPRGARRLGYNGWWLADWVPTANDPLEEILATPEQQLTLTHTQVLAIQDMLDDPWAPRIQPPERHAKVEAIRESIMKELYPPALASVPRS